MSEGFFDKVFGKKEDIEGFDDYLDLEEHIDESSEDAGAEILVRVAEIREIEDSSKVKEQIYNGNIVIVDLSAVEDDELAKERTINEITRATDDVGGDVAGIGNSQILATPSAIKISRSVIGGGDFR
ncbi:MAG: putative cell division protein SepF-like [Candidatus Methanohalarchaeum thermophilum]|uniref:Cell division protein SepF-like n=1 Tax=Methanohalarchaeum thermophilum TaxID=1903181 RepID=A0A1Q6DXW3_METT1|nr:MAG: putative cell division protein SepF-like [Candidatus Methanohalarchaeum thermophilum]